jgi:cytochrome c biogenesis protein CcmG/thiol:disulfide interchange protein DsbE
MRLRAALGAAVGLAMAAAVALAARSPGGLEAPGLFASPTGPTAASGRPAPPFTLPVLGRRQAYSLATQAGTVTVLNFWATWCRYCRQEMPLLDRVAAAGGPGVRVLGVDYTSQEASVAAVAAFVRRLGVRYPVLLDETGATFRQYGVHAYPTTYFVAGNGVITGTVIGQLTPAILRLELGRAGADRRVLAAVPGA